LAFKFSIKSQYGLQAVLYLALNYLGGITPISDIAKTQGIPIRFLEQLLLTLKKKGLLASQRGINGGYSLAKHPSDISIYDVIEALEGPIELKNKKMKKALVIYDAFDSLETSIKKELLKTTLEDLVLKKHQKDKAFIYNI